MTTPLWCLFATALLPYVWSFLGGYYRRQQLGSIDNKEPRAQAAALTGAGARATAAQANAWEALAVFTAAVAVNHLKGVADPDSSATLATVFVAARVVHGVVYVANVDLARSLAFLVGFACCIGLFLA